MAEVPYVSEDNFKNEVLDSSLPVLVDFTATWCGPCKMVDPIIKQLAGEWDGKVKVVKCDADQNPNVLMQFKGGQMVERANGYQPKDKLVSKMGQYI
jgi:thioredoxin 1